MYVIIFFRSSVKHLWKF